MVDGITLTSHHGYNDHNIKETQMHKMCEQKQWIEQHHLL